MNPKPTLDGIADAILDGTPIDWRSVDSPDLPDKAFVEQLKTLAALRSASTSTPPEPWRWGHLQVFERIGRGAFGDVHRAWDPRLDREVALKLLRSDVLDDDRAGSAVIEEGRLLARVPISSPRTYSNGDQPPWLERPGNGRAPAPRPG